jgi:hypothetical protein
MSHLELFHISISQYELYREGDVLVDQLLHEMATDHIVHISEYSATHPPILSVAKRNSLGSAPAFWSRVQISVSRLFVVFFLVAKAIPGQKEFYLLDIMLLLASFHAGFLFGLSFDPEDEGDMFLRNVG